MYYFCATSQVCSTLGFFIASTPIKKTMKDVVVTKKCKKSVQGTSFKIQNPS